MRRRVVVLLGLFALLALVAIASTGSTPVGSGAARRPADELVDTLVSLVLIVVLVGSVGIFYVYYLQRAAAHDERRQGGTGMSRRSLFATAAVVGLMLALALRIALDNNRHDRTGAGSGGSSIDDSLLQGKDRGYEPRFATVPVIVILGVAGVAGLAAYLSVRARRRALGALDLDGSLGLALADVLAETLDDLRAEPDPRRAVVAAYARLERTLAAYGVPRNPSEAPEEYLRRVLVDLDVGTTPARRLTELFAEAKFSRHQVGQEMKDEAIDLLETTRSELLAAEDARAAARDQALRGEASPA